MPWPLAPGLSIARHRRTSRDATEDQGSRNARRLASVDRPEVGHGRRPLHLADARVPRASGKPIQNVQPQRPRRASSRRAWLQGAPVGPAEQLAGEVAEGHGVRSLEAEPGGHRGRAAIFQLVDHALPVEPDVRIEAALAKAGRGPLWCDSTFSTVRPTFTSLPGRTPGQSSGGEVVIGDAAASLPRQASIRLVTALEGGEHRGEGGRWSKQAVRAGSAWPPHRSSTGWPSMQATKRAPSSGKSPSKLAWKACYSPARTSAGRGSRRGPSGRGGHSGVLEHLDGSGGNYPNALKYKRAPQVGAKPITPTSLRREAWAGASR